MLLSFALLGGCGSPGPLTAAELKDVVLSQDNVGETYLDSTKVGAPTDKLGCLQPIGEFVGDAASTKPAARAVSAWSTDSLSGLPGVRSEVRSYLSTGEAEAVYAALAEQADACKQVNVEGEVSQLLLDVSLTETEFTPASEQIGLLAEGSVTGDLPEGRTLNLPSSLWLRLIRVDNNVVLVSYLNYARGEGENADAFTETVLARLEAVIAGEDPANELVDLPKKPQTPKLD